MKNSTNVVVIGGGITGCAILYHLAKMGWTDSTLIERQELTSGSSWHAAGGVFTFLGPNPVAQIHKYSYQMYSELESAGYNCGLHVTGGLNLCRSLEELESYKIVQSAVRRLNIDSEFISLEDAVTHAPILDTSNLIGAVWTPEGGHVDPASATQAFAKAARDLGATIHRHCPVIETNQLPNGNWQVVTNEGTIETEIIVNAAGLWGREVGTLAGIKLPLVPVEHHYLVTDTIPEIEALDFELPQIDDNEINCYARQEGLGLLLGAYEDKCHHWAVDGTPQDFGHELLPNDINRMAWNFEKAMEIIPCLSDAGIKRVINGPMIFSPDLAPLIGPHPELTNYYCANGVMKGFNEGAGIGRIMAEWIIEGEPSFDISIWDVARFGSWVSKDFLNARTAYYYEHRSHRIYPYEEVEAGRPLLTTPIYDRLSAKNGVFGQAFGTEHPNWFAPDGIERKDNLTYGRPNWFEHVNNECRIIRNSVGLMEFSAMAKLEVSGSRAEEWLNYILTNKIPEISGHTILSHMLSEKGSLIGDFSVSRISNDSFMLLGTDVMQLYYLRHFRNYLPKYGVRIQNLSDDWSGLHIAGPNARDLLMRLAEGDLSSDKFPFMSNRIMTIGNIKDVLVVRISYTGELGYELYCPSKNQAALFDQIVDTGKAFDLRLVGTRSLMATRLEKQFPAWGLELSPDYTIFESGVQMFTKFNKGDFIGRESALAQKKVPLREICVSFTVDTDDADAWGDEAIFYNGEWVGYVTSGGYGAHVDKSIAMGYISPDAVVDGGEYSIEILGDMRPAVLNKKPLYDPQGKRMRV